MAFRKKIFYSFPRKNWTGCNKGSFHPHCPKNLFFAVDQFDWMVQSEKQGDLLAPAAADDDDDQRNNNDDQSESSQSDQYPVFHLQTCKVLHSRWFLSRQNFAKHRQKLHERCSANLPSGPSSSSLSSGSTGGTATEMFENINIEN